MMLRGVSDHPCTKCIHMSSEGWSSHRAKLRMALFQDAPATPFADSRRESIFFSILFSFSCARVRRFGSLSLFRLYLTVAHSCTVMLTANLVSFPPVPIMSFSLDFEHVF